MVQWIAELNASGRAMSVQGLMSRNLEDRNCVECLNQANSCPGEQCKRRVRERFEEVETDYITIMSTEDMGYGVFSTKEIPRTTILGEYMGEVWLQYFLNMLMISLPHDSVSAQVSAYTLCKSFD